MTLCEVIEQILVQSPSLASNPFLLYSETCDKIKSNLPLKKEALELYRLLASSSEPWRELDEYISKYKNGEVITPPQKEQKKKARQPKPKPPTPPDNAMVFFALENGFYHLSDDCGKLKKSRLIFQTTYGDAKDCDLINPYPTPKKRQLCPSCGFATPRLKTESRLKKKLKSLTAPYPEIKLWRIQ